MVVPGRSDHGPVDHGDLDSTSSAEIKAAQLRLGSRETNLSNAAVKCVFCFGEDAKIEQHRYCFPSL
jgi:hypothetical protein